MSRSPDFTLSGAISRCPIVYVWKRGTEVLYVGVSKYGLARPLHSSHSMLGDNMLETDQLDIYLFPGASRQKVHQEERKMIDTLNPTLNKRRVR